MTASQAGDSGECNLPFCESRELGLTWNRPPHHSCSVGPRAKLLQLQNNFFFSPARLVFCYNSAQGTCSNEPVLPLFPWAFSSLQSLLSFKQAQEVYRGKGRICTAVRCSCCTSKSILEERCTLRKQAYLVTTQE